MRKRIKRFFLLFPIILLILIFLYCLLTFYFRDSFGPNTWINGIYGTGQTVEAINQQLIQKSGEPKLIVKGFDGQEYPVSAGEITYTYDYSSPIYGYLRGQNPFKWFFHTLEGDSIEVFPHITYDKNQLQQIWEGFDFVSQEMEREITLEIVMGDEGYYLLDGYHNRFDLEATYEYLCLQLDSGVNYIDLSFVENDVHHPEPENYAEIFELWEKVHDFQQTGIVYDMGDQLIPLKGKIAADFITCAKGDFLLNDQGNLIIDEEAISAFVSQLADQYDTKDKERQWLTHDDREIVVPKGTYGTELNQKKEIAFIREHLSEKEELLHIPAYSSEAYVRGIDDIGDSYIEIDLTAQKLFVFQAGESVIETDIVTGNMRKNWDTPAGVFYVYNKQRNRTLRGEGYESFVKYWMPVYKGIGLHDASWRKKFGGDIYLKDGSHGCINIPKAITHEIYEIAEIGMPVIMYY